MSESAHQPEEQYDGPARIDDIEVRVRLRGHFEPIDGHFHWWGRVDRETPLSGHEPGATVTVVTPHGEASARIADVDPWGRFRLIGSGRPPF